MLHIFVDPADMQGEVLTVRGQEARHIRSVLRMKEGEALSASCGEEKERRIYTVEEIGPETVTCRLREVLPADTELPVRVLLFQGLPKGDKMETIIQKSVELGVSEIIPVAMKRCVMRLDPARARKKTARWQTIAESAASQSRRLQVPPVREPLGWKEALALALREADVCLVPYEKEGASSTKDLIERLVPGQTIAVFIGPEGGFEDSEIAEVREAGMRPISLGNRILRTETAGPAFLAWLIYRFEIA